MQILCITYIDSEGVFALIFFQLLDHEVHAREQVPLLMEMRKADLALDKAIESGDPQLGILLMCDTFEVLFLVYSVETKS